MQTALLIALGGALGTLARFGISALACRVFDRAFLPYGTLAVNLLGCFLIGAAQGMFSTRWNLHPSHQMFFLIGFLGGFTTFSAYGWETSYMIHQGQYGRAVLYVLLSNGVGIGLALAGFAIARARTA